MPEIPVDDVLRSLRDVGLGAPDLDAVDARCRAGLRGEFERERLSRGLRGLRWARTGGLRLAATALAAVAAVAGTTLAVPTTRAAIGDVYGTLSDWMSGDDAASPGRPIRPTDDVPAWIRTERGDKRLLVTVHGQSLFAYRRGDRLGFALRNFATDGTLADWREDMDGKKVVPIGPGDHFGPYHHRVPFFGVVAASVARVRVDYADGRSPVTATGLHGAFGVVLDANRRARGLTAFDAAGRVVAHLDMKDYDFRYCTWRGCPPWQP